MNRYASFTLVLAVGALTALGLVMLFSAEHLNASTGDVRGFSRQIVWLGIGVVLCLTLSRLDYRFLLPWAWSIFGVAVLLLLLCFAPHFGKPIHGSHRWIGLEMIGLPSVRFQPSEVAKLAGVIVLAAWYHQTRDRLGSAFYSFWIPGAFVLVLVALIAVEIDIGASALLAAAAGVVMFMAGVRFRWLVLASTAGATAVFYGVQLVPERMARLTAFLDLEAHAAGDGLQQIKGLLAFGAGGWEGVGLGRVLDYVKKLPYSDSDFIFPVIGGELGLGVSLLVVFAYVVILVSGICIALEAPDRFGMLLGSGVVSLIVFQAIINMGVTTALLPNTGLPLPFVSHGGTSLVACLTAIGLLLSIHRQAWVEEECSTPDLHCVNRITPRL